FSQDAWLKRLAVPEQVASKRQKRPHQPQLQRDVGRVRRAEEPNRGCKRCSDGCVYGGHRIRRHSYLDLAAACLRKSPLHQLHMGSARRCRIANKLKLIARPERRDMQRRRLNRKLWGAAEIAPQACLDKISKRLVVLGGNRRG